MDDWSRTVEPSVSRGRRWLRGSRCAGVAAALFVLAVGGGCRGAVTAPTPSAAPDPSSVATSTRPSMSPTSTYDWKPLTGALPGKAVPLMRSRRHISPGPSHEPYNTDPPTSGPHYNYPAKAGFYTVAPPDEQLVHNLEHGYVILWYNTTGLSPYQRVVLMSQVQEAMNAAGDSKLTKTPKLIAVPRPSLKSRLALTSWGRLDELPDFNRQEVLSFIETFRDQAPEGDAP